MNEVNLCRRKMSNLLSDDVKIGFPRGEKGVQLVPMLLGEGPVHGRRNVDHLVGLVDFSANKFGLQH